MKSLSLDMLNINQFVAAHRDARMINAKFWEYLHACTKRPVRGLKEDVARWASDDSVLLPLLGVELWRCTGFFIALIPIFLELYKSYLLEETILATYIHHIIMGIHFIVSYWFTEETGCVLLWFFKTSTCHLQQRNYSGKTFLAAREKFIALKNIWKSILRCSIKISKYSFV